MSFKFFSITALKFYHFPLCFHSFQFTFKSQIIMLIVNFIWHYPLKLIPSILHGLTWLGFTLFYDIQAFIIPVLQMRELSHRMIKWYLKNHTSGKWYSWDSNQSLAPESMLLTITECFLSQKVRTINIF